MRKLSCAVGVGRLKSLAVCPLPSGKLRRAKNHVASSARKKSRSMLHSSLGGPCSRFGDAGERILESSGPAAGDGRSVRAVAAGWVAAILWPNRCLATHL
jgi:hypothetical protein